MMLRYIDGNSGNFIKRLELILDQRRVKSDHKSIKVKKIIKDIRKKKDKGVLQYEKKFLKIKKISIKL